MDHVFWSAVSFMARCSQYALFSAFHHRGSMLCLFLVVVDNDDDEDGVGEDVELVSVSLSCIVDGEGDVEAISSSS